MDTMWAEINEQTAVLNRLCRTNGFTTAEKSGAYEIFEAGQNIGITSLKGLNHDKLNYIESLADLFMKNNKEDMTPAIVRYSTFFGGKDNQDVGSFPHKNQFEGRLKKEFKNFHLSRLEWSVGTYIESLRFTMSDGTISPKFGNKAFTHSCDFTGPLRRVETKYRERGVVSMTLITDNEELTI